VVACSLYIEGPQILAQRPPVPEEEPCDLQEIETDVTSVLQSLL
jgi:hypothetical protein